MVDPSLRSGYSSSPVALMRHGILIGPSTHRPRPLRCRTVKCRSNLVSVFCIQLKVHPGRYSSSFLQSFKISQGFSSGLPCTEWKDPRRYVTLSMQRVFRLFFQPFQGHSAKGLIPRGLWQARLMLLAAKVQLGIDMEYLEARWDQILTLVPDLGGVPVSKFRSSNLCHLRPLSSVLRSLCSIPTQPSVLLSYWKDWIRRGEVERAYRFFVALYTCAECKLADFSRFQQELAGSCSV